MNWSGVPVSPLVYKRLLAARRNGIVNPLVLYQECQRAGVPYALGCAILEEETGGGKNEWGHDPTIFVGGYDARHGVHYGSIVTEAAYRAYKAERGPTGGGGMQGVGATQLTYYAFQDRADALGGCWVPRWNIRVGMDDLAANVKKYGLAEGVARYNGTGSAAEAYSERVLALYARWQKIV